jgi:DNA (cytosine-5)-methyltransferase 1
MGTDTRKPRLLDLFCCAGGAGMGYHRAGFDVVGVDINPQPNYPFEFIQADALSVSFAGFDAVHASPPCQGYSAMSSCRPGLAETYPLLIEPVREMLEASGLPYVIENVVGAPLKNPIELCGQMFGLDLYRHRLFESNVPLTAPEHPTHVKAASRAGHWEPGTVMSVAGHVAPMKVARDVMGMDWTTRAELVEAIPPAYTEHIGRQLVAYLRARVAA